MTDDTVRDRPELPLLALAALAVLGIIVLVALHDAVPDVLRTVAVLGAGGSAGLASPFRRRASSPAGSSTSSRPELAI